ncbi:MAG: Stk1 family PASTA domain-containing Ser/Thr kinase [Mycoplasmatota bacterium]
MIAKGSKINDRYQIVKMIGEGGMANVYLAYDTILDRNVAIKVLRGDLAEDEKFVRRFQREAISSSLLNHPNIVEMYDVGEDDGKYYIVMEFIEGKTLKSLVKRRGKLTVPEVVDVMTQLASGIACAHDSYIIHRDIKPQNIMIYDNGRVKITDFGIATAINSNELTQTNSVMGSVYYLPPEQANGSGATIKSDIYSLGILMYELLIGKLPFKGENAVEIAIKQMRDPIPSVKNIDETIPQSIENIVLKCCAKNPKNRYNSIEEMQIDINMALDEDKKNIDKHIYIYPEQDLDETKKIELTRSEKSKNKKIEEPEEKSKSEKGINILLIVSITVACLIAMAMCFVLIVYPQVKEVEEVKIPDVSDMSEQEAIKSLEDLGLSVSLENSYDSSTLIEEGLVIGTSPSATKTVKVGQEVTLIISTGVTGFLLDSYVGENYLEVSGALKALGINVLIDYEDVENSDDYIDLEDYIISQKPSAGERVTEGDTVTLYLPNVEVLYPDFIAEEYTVDEVSLFCTKYGVTLNIAYQESDLYLAGTIISQDKPLGYTVKENTTLTIVVITAPIEEEVEDSDIVVDE